MKRQDMTIEEVEFNKWVHKQTIKEVINWAIGLCDKILNSNNNKCLTEKSIWKNIIRDTEKKIKKR